MKWMMVLTVTLVKFFFFSMATEGEWQPTGRLESPRYCHTSTLLPSGKILVVGGSNSGALSSAEIYDPSTGTWTETESLATRRSAPTATLLPSGEVLVVGGINSTSGHLSSAEIYDPSTGTWTETGSLTAARSNHTATLLPSGRVLVAGGQSNSGFSSSAEVYDPSTGTWTETESLATERSEHTSTLLPLGRVLVAGGHNGNGTDYLSSVEIYDSNTGTWTESGNLVTARSRHTSTLLPSGNVLVVGGVNGSSLSSVEVFNPSAGSAADTGNLATARKGHTSTLLPSGKVLVAGGRSNTNLSSTELYDPIVGTWTSAGNFNARRERHTSTLLPSGKVLAAGGSSGILLSSSEIYDPSIGGWTGTGSLATERGYHTSTLLPSGKVLVAGGYDNSYLSSTELYDPIAETWTETGNLTPGRSWHTSTRLPSGEVLVVGGWTGSSYLSSVEVYDPSATTWRETVGLAVGRYHHTSTLLISGEVLVVGGINGGVELSSTEIYNPRTETWTDAGNLVGGRMLHTSTLLHSGKVLVVGGSSSPNAEVYDPNTRTWAETGSLATGRRNHTSTLLPSGRVLVVGGYNNGTLSSAEIYDPSQGIWTDTGDLATPRSNHTATLLPSGMVLAVGGSDGITLSNAELYDPSTGTWTDAGHLATSRSRHTSTLLPSGKLLVAGGYNYVGPSYLSSAEIYEVVTPQESRRPTIQSASQILRYGESFAITGLFRGDSEASGGNSRNSAVNHPIIHLRSWDGTEHHTLVPDPQPNFWDAPRPLTVSSFPPTINPGRHLLTLTVAGVPSAPPVPVDMECSLAITTHPTDQTVPLGETATFTVETQGGRLYQWQKNGMDISGETGPMYTIPSVTLLDDGTQYRVVVDSGCTSETAATAELIIADSTPPVAEVTHPTGGEYWLLTDPNNPIPPNTEIITWSMSDNIRICHVEVELIYSDDSGATWQVADSLGTFGDTQNCPFPGEQTTNLTYEMPTSPPPSGAPGSLYKARLHATDRAGNTTTAESPNPFFMTHSGDARTLILTNLSRIDATPDLIASLQNLADHPTVFGFLANLDEVTTVNALYDAWDAGIATANDVLFAEGGIHDHILNLLEIYPEVEYLIVVGDDSIVPMTRLTDRTFRLPEAEYAGELPASTVQQALHDNKYLSDDPLATAHPLRPNQLNDTIHLADLGIGRLVETPEEIRTAIATYIQQDGFLDLSLREPKALVTGYDFLQDSARRIDRHWGNVYTPEEVDGELISGDWSASSVEERRALLANAMAQAPGLMSLNGHATHAEEGVPGIDRFEIVGLPAEDVAALDLTGCIIYAVGCHGGLPVPDEADLPQSFLGAGATAYLAGSGYGWGLLQGIGLAERLAVILTEELATSGPQTISDAIRRGKQRYYFESPRWDAYDNKTLHQPILYGFPMYSFETGAPPPPSSPPVHVTRTVSRDPLPPHVAGLDLTFDFAAPGLYQKYDADGLEITDCPPEGCYYELYGLASGETDLPIEPYFLYNSSLAATSQHGILWLGGPYLEESGWTPIFGLIASNEEDDIEPGSTPPMILLPPRGPRPTGPPDTEACPAQDEEVNGVVVTTGEVAQDESGEYSIHRLMQEVDLKVFYFNNLDNPSENCDREGPAFIGDDEPHDLQGTTLHWTVDAQDASGVWRVLVVWDDQQEARWSPLELSYDGEHWIGSLPVAGRGHLTYVLQAVDRRGNVAWKEVNTTLPESGVPLRLADPISVDIGEGEADLEAALVAPPEVNASDAFTATFNISNHGPDPANQLTATLTLPPDMIYTFSGGDDWTCNLDVSHVVLCTRDFLESDNTNNSSEIFIQLIAPELGGEYLLRACVDAAEGDPSQPNCSEAPILVIDPSMTDLSIVKEDGGVVAIPGDPLIYSITVTNQGPNPAPDALVTDEFPDVLLDVTWTCTATVGSSCTPSESGDIMDEIQIASGGTLIYIAHTTVDENVSEPIDNIATVELLLPMEDFHPGNNSDQTTTQIDPHIFSDGFESGDCSEWTSCSGLP